MQDNQTSILDTTTNQAIVRFNPHAVAVGNLSKAAESINVVAEYLTVGTWQLHSRAKKALYGQLVEHQHVDITDSTGEVKRLPATLVYGFWSKDGSQDKDETPSLFLIGQASAARTLRNCPIGCYVKVAHTGSTQATNRVIQQFTINILKLEE